jgi:predicted MFS family arabinose efflux permease
VGAIVGGLVALRIRPSRPFLVSLACTAPIALQLAALAAQVPAPLLAAANFASAAGLSIHLTLWFTVFQREVPEHAQSRVSSYDALGSFVLLPVGAALAGPAAVAFGVSETLWAAAAISLACTVILVSLPSVRAIRAPEVAPAVAASSA